MGWKKTKAMMTESASHSMCWRAGKVLHDRIRMSESPPKPDKVPGPDYPDIEQALKAAMAHQRRGQYAQAEQLYRQVLSAEPTQPMALQMLGVLAHMAGQGEMALELIRSAIHHAPGFVAAHSVPLKLSRL